jgi:hypothetical protein
MEKKVEVIKERMTMSRIAILVNDPVRGGDVPKSPSVDTINDIEVILPFLY